MEKYIKIYKSNEISKQEKDSQSDWSLLGSDEKSEATYSICEEHYWQRGIDINAQRLRGFFKVTKLSQN